MREAETGRGGWGGSQRWLFSTVSYISLIKETEQRLLRFYYALLFTLLT